MTPPDPRWTLAKAFDPAARSLGDAHHGYRGTRTTRVEGDGGAWYLREYPEHWRRRVPQARFELAWLERLAGRGLPVARPRRTPDGHGLLDEGGLPVAAFDAVPGEPRFPLSASDAEALGALLARVHATPAPEAPPEVFRYDVASLLDVPLAFGEAHLAPEARDAWRRLGRALRDLVARVPLAGDPFGPVHGDLHQWNVRWTDAGPHALDFALCGVGYRLYDLAAFLWPLRESPTEDAVSAMCDAFVAGYDRERPLRPEERAALDAFVKLRDLWEMRDFAEWDANFDAARDVPGYLDRFTRHPASLRW